MTADPQFPDYTDDEIATAAEASEAGLDFYAAEYPLADFRRDYRHLRDMIGGHVKRVWSSPLDDDEKAELVAQTVAGGQQLVSHITQTYAAKAFRAVFDPFHAGPDITDRPNVTKRDQYLRVADEPDHEAQLRRLETMANTDMQLAKTRTFYRATNGTDGAPIKMYRRVPGGDNPCELCELASDQVYFTDDLMPIHDNCGCDVEEETGEGLTAHDIAYHHLVSDDEQDDPKIVDLDEDSTGDDRKQIAIRDHGELGPVLTWAHQDFTGPADLPNPIAPRPLPGEGSDGQ